ncbi:PLP-dependent aminotransferase family protein [Brevibacillus fluminis]|uniref:PLP-dependent aminotransferase family protein n=1 Tax=Brevibacillus fluminis TaxID=511487 RepID=A0A3M8DCZ4_9BACL|nr:PLP-dependent aminotransferase family protein [Brevibacillus fluminis]RNB85459.1 PLP-dependent aminotransferase family protein [Brevibacillus fluminis]
MFISDWKPNRAHPAPLYKQITDFIREKITNGEWPLGSKIPPERKLAQAFGVNRSTIVTAFAELTAEGLIEGSSGSGTRVVNDTWAIMAAHSAPDWDAYTRAGVYRPNLPTVQDINQSENSPTIIRLGSAGPAPELFPTDMLQTILQKLPTKMKSLDYEDPKGLLFLREQVSEYAKKRGIDASPSSILIVSGALQALQLISIGLLKRGSVVLTENPSYVQSLSVFQSAGMKMIGLPLDKDGLGTNTIPQNKREQKATILYTIPCFHNPTGILMSEERRKQLLTICEREQLPIVEDDVYRDLWLDHVPPAPLKAKDKNGLVLYLGSMSKTLGPGLRIGWLIGPDPVINRLADLKMQLDYGSSSLSQWTVAECLQSGLYEQHLQVTRETLRKRRDAALHALEKYMTGIASWTSPTGGFFIWLRLHRPVSMRALFEKALQQEVLLYPGNIYDRSDHQHLRISYGYASPRELEEGISRLSKIIQKFER